MKKIWFTGANGLIDNYLLQAASGSSQSRRVRVLTCADFDLLDFAAITIVSEAQKDPKLARRVNVEATAFRLANGSCPHTRISSSC